VILPRMFFPLILGDMFPLEQFLLLTCFPCGHKFPCWLVTSGYIGPAQRLPLGAPPPPLCFVGVLDGLVPAPFFFNGPLCFPSHGPCLFCDSCQGKPFCEARLISDWTGPLEWDPASGSIPQATPGGGMIYFFMGSSLVISGGCRDRDQRCLGYGRKTPASSFF